MWLSCGSEPYDPPVLAEQAALQAERLMYRCASYERKRLWNVTQRHTDSAKKYANFSSENEENA